MGFMTLFIAWLIIGFLVRMMVKQNSHPEKPSPVHHNQTAKARNSESDLQEPSGGEEFFLSEHAYVEETGHPRLHGIPAAEQELADVERKYGQEHPKTMDCLRKLVILYIDAESWAETEIYLRRLLVASEKQYGPNHIKTGECQLLLGRLLHRLDRNSEAETMLLQALAIFKKNQGAEGAGAGIVTGILAGIYRSRKELKKSRVLQFKSAALLEKALGPDHQDFAHSVRGLGDQAWAEGKYADAEKYWKKVLRILQPITGLKNMESASVFSCLADLEAKRRNFSAAEEWQKQALEIIKTRSVSKSPRLINSTTRMGFMLWLNKKPAPALEMLFKASAMLEGSPALSHSLLAIETYMWLAKMLTAVRRYAEAEKFSRRLISVSEEHFGYDHTALIGSLLQLSHICRCLGKNEEAGIYARRARLIQERAKGAK